MYFRFVNCLALACPCPLTLCAFFFFLYSSPLPPHHISSSASLLSPFHPVWEYRWQPLQPWQSSGSGPSLFALLLLHRLFWRSYCFGSCLNQFSSKPLFIHSEHTESKLSFTGEICLTQTIQRAIKQDKHPPAFFWIFFFRLVDFVYSNFFSLALRNSEVWKLKLNLLKPIKHLVSC